MSDPALQPADLGTYLFESGSDIDSARASLILTEATNLCLSIVNPLPPGANAVILDVAGRAYLNPGNAAQQSAGGDSVNFGAVSGGLWLTRQNKRTLRRLNGAGGAFTIDTVPATAGQNLPWWDLDVQATSDYPYYLGS